MTIALIIEKRPVVCHYRLHCFVPHICISQRRPEVETDGHRESKLKKTARNS